MGLSCDVHLGLRAMLTRGFRFSTTGGGGSQAIPEVRVHTLSVKAQCAKFSVIHFMYATSPATTIATGHA